jgi:DNA polymerase
MSIFNNIKKCNKCDLCNNQPPLAQKSSDADVFWIGISAVKTENNLDSPLSNKTNSGKLIDQIESTVSDVSFHKTNIVKCVPFDDKNKIRYPSSKEMQKCYAHLESEINDLNPNMIVLLGKQVATFMLKKFGISEFELANDFNYKTISAGGHTFLPVHHPSYVLIYKRKFLADYSNRISTLLNYGSES